MTLYVVGEHTAYHNSQACPLLRLSVKERGIKKARQATALNGRAPCALCYGRTSEARQ